MVFGRRTLVGREARRVWISFVGLGGGESELGRGAGMVIKRLVR